MGAVDTTYTFTATDTITSTKMNNIIDQTTMTSDAIIGNTLEVASGKLKVRAQGITSNEMATGSVSSDAIANGSVTSTKTDSNGPKWGSIYTDVGSGTASNPYYLSIAPNRTGNGDTVVQLGSVVGNNSNAYLYRSSGTNGQFSIVNNGTGNFTIQSVSGTLYLNGPNGFNVYKDASNNANFPVPDGIAPIFGCRAWVNFDATRDSTGATNSSNTNRYIRKSGNVTSVLKTGTGVYTVTFATALPDADFAVYGSVSDNGGTTGGTTNQFVNGYQASSSTARITTTTTGSNMEDYSHVSVCVIR